MKWLLCLTLGLSAALVPVVGQEVPLRPPPSPPQPSSPSAPVKVIEVAFGHMNYPRVVRLLDLWAKEYPGLATRGSYGKSSRGTPLEYVRLRSDKEGPRLKVMLTACIHGNEPLATATVLSWCATLCASYGSDPDATRLLDTRDILVVPVVSPDSFGFSRTVDGVDPNRDFAGLLRPGHKSIAPVRALQELFQTEKPRAILSGHTSGRMVLVPWGETNKASRHAADYQRVAGRMAELMNYRLIQASRIYGRPISGSELDWYYYHGSRWVADPKEGLRGAFAVVLEMGTTMTAPSQEQTHAELRRTWKGLLHFLEEAPRVDIFWPAK